MIRRNIQITLLLLRTARVHGNFHPASLHAHVNF